MMQLKLCRRRSNKERKRAFRGCPGLPLRLWVGICDRPRSVLYNCVCVEVRKEKKKRA